MTTIGWKFPPTGGGVEGGYNHGGMTHFQGDRFAGLAREAIQNSLDARKSDDRPVHVTFEVKRLSRKDLPGYEGLLEIVKRCIQEASGDEKAQSELQLAKNILRHDRIAFLRIIDRETTGLSGSKWAALLKKEGSSDKDRPGAGGSFGIGKNAPFTMSPLRTVYYWSRFENGSEYYEKFQGKAILISHLDDNEEYTQSIGFFGAKKGCLELEDANIPDVIRSAEPEDRGVGTSLWIPGFDDSKGWRDSIARSIVTNFFCAIEEGDLEVLIEPDSNTMGDLLTIEKNNLREWFDYLISKDAQSAEDSKLLHAKAFWEIMASGSVLKEKEDKDLGHCKLWIAVDDKYEGCNRVALIRLNGMLITEQQARLIRFPGTRPFAAVCRFDSVKGNELLRGMENPKHDQFQPEFLPSGAQRRGRNALRRITDWIREEINSAARPETSGSTTTLTELAELLPDIEPDEGLGAVPDETGDRPLDGAPLIRLKPLRPPRQRTDVIDDDALEGGSDDGDDEGGDSGDGDGDGNGNGDHSGSGTTIPLLEPVHIESVRCLPLPDAANRLRILFTPKSNAAGASLSLVEAGDSDFVPRADLKIVELDGTKKKLSEFRTSFAANERVGLVIEGDHTVSRRAWRLLVKQPKDRDLESKG